jgi:hypothetical protein
MCVCVCGPQIRPALLTGSLGYAFGTLIGVSMASALRVMSGSAA